MSLLVRGPASSFQALVQYISVTGGLAVTLSRILRLVKMDVREGNDLIEIRIHVCMDLSHSRGPPPYHF